MKDVLPLTLAVIAGLAAIVFDFVALETWSTVAMLIATAFVLYYLVVRHNRKKAGEPSSPPRAG